MSDFRKIFFETKEVPTTNTPNNTPNDTTTNTPTNEVSNYDSTAETLLHIKTVQQFLNKSAIELLNRANVHDNSKLKSPEKELFDK